MFNSTFLVVLTTIIAFFTLLYPVMQKETTRDNFYIHPKKYEYSSELKTRDINRSIMRAKKALYEDLYRVGQAFEAVKFQDAWIASSPNLLGYLKKKNNPYSNTSHELLVQSLGILYDLIIAHKEEHNNKFLIKGFEIINEWYRHNARFNPFQSPLVWNDQGSSERILAILTFYDYAQQYMNINIQYKNMINKIVKDSILYLASPYNYKYKANHGIYQDFALLIVASYLKDVKQQQKYFKIALNRFKQQVISTYDSNGVHLENSPKYHLMITDLLNDFAGYAKSLNLDLDKEVLDRIKRANKNKYFFVLNNGHIAPVGDSMYIPYTSFKKLNNEILISQDAGYVIFKNKEFYLLVRTQSINAGHRHQDQLSYIYEYRKDLIVSDPGFLDYSSSKENIYVHSRKAHNVIYSKDQKEINYYFTKVLNNVHFFYCQLESEDKTISRIFLLDKESKELVIQDTINDHKKEKLSEMLNLSGDVLKVKQTKSVNEVVMKNKHKYYIESFQNKDHIQSNILYGSTKPFLGGWRAIPYKNLVPSYALWTELNKNKNILFTRIISKAPVAFSHVSNDLIELSLNSEKYRYDLKTIRKQAQQVKKSVTHDSMQKVNYLIKKVKKKIKPLYFKRIKIFKNEILLILLLMLLYIFMRNKYVKWLFLTSCIGVSLFNILVFINT